MAIIEAEAHRILDRFRTSGEWFDCAPELAVAAVNAAAATVGKGLQNIDPAVSDPGLYAQPQPKNGGPSIKPRKSWGTIAWLTIVLVGLQWFMMKALNISNTNEAVSLSVSMSIPYVMFVAYLLWRETQVYFRRHHCGTSWPHHRAYNKRYLTLSIGTIISSPSLWATSRRLCIPACIRTERGGCVFRTNPNHTSFWLSDPT